MKRDKARVTVGGGLKFLITIAALAGITFYFMSYETDNVAVIISLYAYTLLFVYLSVVGSNSRVAIWISQRKIFTTIFLMPSIICAICSVAFFSLGDNASPELTIFAVLLTILSIPFALLLARIQGGIRRGNALLAFWIFPVAIYLVCRFFAKTAVLVAVGASIVVLIVSVIISFVEFSRDHKADYSSVGSSASSGNYSAYWDGHPMSDVKDKVIHLKGTIIVEYTGTTLFTDSANKVVNDLIQAYVADVNSSMPGYRVDVASVEIEYVNVGFE